MTKQFARYESYKDSGVEWLGQVPAHWEIKRVKSLFRLIVEPAPVNNQQILLSLYTDIGVKPRSELEERGNKASTTDGYLQVKKDDIVVNKLLAWMGAVGISNYNGVTSPAYDIIRPFKQINSVFYHYLFRNQIFVQEMKRHSRGIMDMRLRLYFDKFGEIFLPVPTFQEQVNIVQYIEKVESQIDEAIAQKEKMIDLLKEYRQITINNAVTKGLDPNTPMKDSGIAWIGQIPTHWEVKKLKNICEINKKSLPENTHSNFKIDYVDIGSVTFEGGINRIEEFIFKTSPSRARRLTKAGDIIISTVRTYLKAIDLIDEIKSKYVYSTGFAILSPMCLLIHSKFLYNFVKSDFLTEQVTLNSKGMSYPAINSTDLSNLLVILPSLEEQKQIAAFLDKKMAQINEAISLKQSEIEKLKEYKATLIDSAVTGKIKINL